MSDLKSNLRDDLEPVVDPLIKCHQQTGQPLAKTFKAFINATFASYRADRKAEREAIETYTPDPTPQLTNEVGRLFAVALGEILNVMEASEQPVIGEIYETIGATSDSWGQHFTEWGVAKTKAELIISEESIEAASTDDPLTIADPTCGTGRLLLAAAMHISEYNNSQTPAYFQGTEIDPICAKMGAINLATHGMPGRVIHGDSLTLETHTVWEITPTDKVVIKEIPEDTQNNHEEPAPNQQELTRISMEEGRSNY